MGWTDQLKDIFGADSPEWAALREDGWLRLFRDRKGNVVSPRVFQSNLTRTLNEAPTTMKELYGAPSESSNTGCEIRQYHRLARTRESG